MSGYSVYILFSTSRDKTYIGQTRELALRLDQHNAGKVRFTKPFRPWVLIHSEQCSSREEALDRERWFKSGAGRRRITRILSQLNVQSDARIGGSLASLRVRARFIGGAGIPRSPHDNVVRGKLPSFGTWEFTRLAPYHSPVIGGAGVPHPPQNYVTAKAGVTFQPTKLRKERSRSRSPLRFADIQK